MTLSRGLRQSSMLDARVPVVRPVEVMGLKFANPLGLAAGFDRTGGLLPTMATLGFGHIEVGTITRATKVTLRGISSGPLRVGVNIGSARRGLDRHVLDDYLAALARVWHSADYIVANLSSPFAARDGDLPGVETLITSLGEAWRQHRTETGRHVPLLVKLTCARSDTALPAAIADVCRQKLSGIVLVSSSLRLIAAACDRLEGAAVVSVGGVDSAADVDARLEAGAALVQLYTALVRDGPSAPQRILTELASD